MRSISIQVQPFRSSGINMVKVIAEFQAIADMNELVRHHAFDEGDDKGAYFNFTFGTPYAKKLWKLIKERCYDSGNICSHMLLSSMAMCSSEEGWADYMLLYHFDPSKVLHDTRVL